MNKLCFEIAVREFSGRKDRAGVDYINHLIFVAKEASILSADFKINEDELSVVYCSALLHDLFEDTNVDEIELREFVVNENIIDIIKLLTKTNYDSYDEYICAISSNKLATIVKLSDLKHNMDLTRLKTISDKDIERVKKYHKAFVFLKSIYK